MKDWEIFLAIMAGVTALGVFFKKVIKPVYRWFKRWDTMFREFIPDHGKSMKDQVTNMEISIGAIKSTQAALIRLDNLPVIECNGGGRCIMVNKSWKILSGMTLDEAQGWGWLNVIHSSDRERVHDEWINAISANSEFNSTYKFVNKVTHDIFNVECICVINRNAKNEVVSIVGTVIRLQDDAPVKSDKSTPPE